MSAHPSQGSLHFALKHHPTKRRPTTNSPNVTLKPSTTDAMPIANIPIVCGRCACSMLKRIPRLSDVKDHQGKYEEHQQGNHKGNHQTGIFWEPLPYVLCLPPSLGRGGAEAGATQRAGADRAEDAGRPGGRSRVSSGIWVCVSKRKTTSFGGLPILTHTHLLGNYSIPLPYCVTLNVFATRCCCFFQKNVRTLPD